MMQSGHHLQAIILSNERSGMVADCTRGFVFFATPHSGSKLADLPETIKTLGKLVLDAPTNLIANLSTRSRELSVSNAGLSYPHDLTETVEIIFIINFKTS
jgi:hypothetical protein